MYMPDGIAQCIQDSGGAKEDSQESPISRVSIADQFENRWKYIYSK